MLGRERGKPAAAAAAVVRASLQVMMRWLLCSRDSLRETRRAFISMPHAVRLLMTEGDVMPPVIESEDQLRRRRLLLKLDSLVKEATERYLVSKLF